MPRQDRQSRKGRVQYPRVDFKFILTNILRSQFFITVVTFCIQLQFSSDAKCYKMLVINSMTNLRLGESDEMRNKNVYSTVDFKPKLPNIWTIHFYITSLGLAALRIRVRRGKVKSVVWLDKPHRILNRLTVGTRMAKHYQWNKHEEPDQTSLWKKSLVHDCTLCIGTVTESLQ